MRTSARTSSSTSPGSWLFHGSGSCATGGWIACFAILSISACGTYAIESSAGWRATTSAIAAAAAHAGTPRRGRRDRRGILRARHARQLDHTSSSVLLHQIAQPCEAAYEMRLGGGRFDLEYGGVIADREVMAVAQHERRALLRGELVEALEQRAELFVRGELNGRARLGNAVPALGDVLARRRALGRRGRRLRSARLAGQPAEQCAAQLAAAQRAEAHRRRDPEEPRGRGFRIAQIVDRLARAGERLLDRFLGLGAVAEEVVGDPVALACRFGREIGEQTGPRIGSRCHV